LQTRRDLYAKMARRIEEYNKAFEEFTRDLCVSGLVEEAYLVGSRARGDHMPSSDFDIVVVVNDKSDPLDIVVKIRLLKKTNIPIDVIVLKRSELKDPVYAEMLKYAKKICK